MSPTPFRCLSVSEHIDWKDPDIIKLANKLAGGKKRDSDIAKICFEWVRDEIKHSWDFKIDPVTCKASDVLKFATDFCYAKSHLLAALLRANNIPAGLCYQRLSINDDGAPYSLHGLNAIYLKENINAQFSPPKEQLAFPINESNEKDFPDILVEPLDVVVDALL